MVISSRKILQWILPLLLGQFTMADEVHLHSPYSIIIDGGSTGSRLHIFEFVKNATTSECIRRGSARANVPLSAYGRPASQQTQPLDPSHVAAHLLEAFRYAADVVPSDYHNATRVMYQATAGMRLLEPNEQDAVYDALFEGLIISDSFVFSSLRRNDIGTLSGELEGFYGAVAANYLRGVIDTRLQTTSSQDTHEEEEHHHHGPLGALDMGGSSTQIVYLPGESAASCHDDQVCVQASREIPSQLNGEDFFSTSYLAYGVDQFRERLWNTWVEERREEEADYEDSCSSKVIENPCTFKGYEIEWQGYTLLGTGDAHECVTQVQRLIPHHEQVVDSPQDSWGTKVVGGVEHPPLRGKFFAMSLYFFSLDSLRVLSHPSKDAHEALNLSWPNPSIEELYNALDGLCSRSWLGDLEEIQHEAHAYTRPEVLPHRCLESVYMVTLLRDGFGFEPTSRDITFTFLVDGSEVEWSLGMALALHAEEQDAVYESIEDAKYECNDTMEDYEMSCASSLMNETTKDLIMPEEDHSPLRTHLRSFYEFHFAERPFCA